MLVDSELQEFVSGFAITTVYKRLRIRVLRMDDCSMVNVFFEQALIDWRIANTVTIMQRKVITLLVDVFYFRDALPFGGLVIPIDIYFSLGG